MLAEACVAVATHRHGCCVLQRAIDAATVEQSRLLVSHVSKHALQLMQVRVRGVELNGFFLVSRLLSAVYVLMRRLLL